MSAGAVRNSAQCACRELSSCSRLQCSAAVAAGKPGTSKPHSPPTETSFQQPSLITTIGNHLLAPHYDDHKGSRFGRRTRSGLCVFELRGRQIDPVCSIIHVHGLSAKSRRNGLHRLPLAALLLGNAQLAFAGARECLMTVPACGVHACGDWKIPNNLAVVCAHYEQLLRFATADEESVRLCIDGQADGRTARSDRPVREHFPSLKLDH